MFSLWLWCLPSILGGQSYFKTSVFDPQDTVFLVKDFGGNFKVKIEVNDSTTLLNALKFFKIDTLEFKKFKIQIPTDLYFPFPRYLIKRYKDESYDTSPHIPIFYLSENGDTYYSIARKLFGIPLITLMRRNQIEEEGLSVGKPLLVGWYALRDSVKNHNIKDFHNPIYLGDINQIREQYEVENGIAIIEGKDGPTNQNFALSNSYAIGTEVLIYNPVTGIALQVEIVGKIPLTLFDDAVSFVIGENIANRIGAKDKKFHIGILRKKNQ